jgi:methylated-DNA-[protein]-cysteine S-methyltransferase
MRLHVARFRVPVLGYVQVVATASGVVRVALHGDEARLREDLKERFNGAEVRRGNDVTADAGREIRRYLGGGPDPDVRVVLPEKGFSARVWRQIARIPRGEVRSYGRIARALGRAEAARAVGQACGNNPVPIVVPCHRVVASDGSIGGFGGGVDLKRRLLRLEGASVKS